MTEHCCEQLRAQVEHTCAEHPDPFDCPDALVAYSPQLREYGLIVHDREHGPIVHEVGREERTHEGGHPMRAIAYCPWCGTKLPASLREG